MGGLYYAPFTDCTADVHDLKADVVTTLNAWPPNLINSPPKVGKLP